MATSAAHRIASLDLVRGAAAFAVAIPHYFVLNSSDWPTANTLSILAVEVFFVLSGFVLAPQILFCCRDGRPVNLGVFLSRRWMRTIPPFLVALVAISLLTDQLPTSDFWRYAFYVQNAVSQHNMHDYYPVAWSLSVEEWFYVIFPALILCCSRIFRRSDIKFAAVVAAAFIIGITIARTTFGELPAWDAQVRRIVLFRIDSIAYGFLLYLLLAQIPESGALRKSLAPVGFLAFIVFAGLGLLLTGRATAEHDPISQQLFAFVAACFGMSAIALSYLSSRLLSGRHMSAICVYLGRISYSVYLFHIMLIMLLRPILAGLPIIVQVSVYLAMCVLFSSLFYFYFEAPILAARPRFRRPPPAASETTDAQRFALSST
jgi:peptidoglycan/LPS O-acetylase OafA/YrhL